MAAAAEPCDNIRGLFYSQAGAAAALERRERSSMNEINTERLATLMAAFENGDTFHASNPFDCDDPLEFSQSHASQMVQAFAALAKSDTPRVEGMTEEDHQTALVAAGLLQGMWIGFEYAHRDVYGEEG